MNEDILGMCPNCGHQMDGYDCFECGYCSLNLEDNEYETPEGNIVHCTEEEAMERGYIAVCPACGENLITWWEKEDHGKCITCWHADRIE